MPPRRRTGSAAARPDAAGCRDGRLARRCGRSPACIEPDRWCRWRRNPPRRRARRRRAPRPAPRSSRSMAAALWEAGTPRLLRQAAASSWRRLPISHPEYGVGQPALEARVVAEEAEQIGVVLHQPDNDAPQRLVMLDPGILLVRIFPCILIGGVD